MCGNFAEQTSGCRLGAELAPAFVLRDNPTREPRRTPRSCWLALIIAGILILIIPRLLNIIVAIYLIVIGLVGLGFLR